MHRDFLFFIKTDNIILDQVKTKITIFRCVNIDSLWDNYEIKIYGRKICYKMSFLKKNSKVFRVPHIFVMFGKSHEVLKLVNSSACMQ